MTTYSVTDRSGVTRQMTASEFTRNRSEMIERGPLSIHKNLVIQCLRKHPEDMERVSPGWTGTVEELIAALEADPHDWIVNGTLGDLPE